MNEGPPIILMVHSFRKFIESNNQAAMDRAIVAIALFVLLRFRIVWRPWYHIAIVFGPNAFTFSLSLSLSFFFLSSPSLSSCSINWFCFYFLSCSTFPQNSKTSYFWISLIWCNYYEVDLFFLLFFCSTNKQEGKKNKREKDKKTRSLKIDAPASLSLGMLFELIFQSCTVLKCQ